MQNIRTLFASATPEQRERGRAWYPAMRDACESIARETRTPLERTVACAAITSPGVQLKTNLAFTRSICAGGEGGLYPARMIPACRRVLSGDVAPQDGVGGPKVTAFYRAILGDDDAVVLDRWALRALGHEKDGCTAKQYATYAATLRDAARETGETPRTLQAILWIVLRDRHERGGTRVKLADIHELGGQS